MFENEYIIKLNNTWQDVIKSHLMQKEIFYTSIYSDISNQCRYLDQKQPYKKNIWMAQNYHFWPILAKLTQL